MTLEKLKAALAAEAVKVDDAVLVRVFRRFANVGGCIACGAKERILKLDNKTLACCGTPAAKGK